MHANMEALLAFADPCNHAPAIVMQAMPQLPGTLESLHITQRREVLLEVVLDKRGQVTLVKMLASTKNRDLDSAAVRSARASTYSPAMVHCRPARGETLFRVLYDPDTE
jgi:TonB family protein